MKQLTDGNEIGLHYNFMFFDVNNAPQQAQISYVVFKLKETEDLKAKLGFYQTPAFVYAHSPIPISSPYPQKIDIQIHFLVDEPKFIEIKDLELIHRNRTVEEYFRLASQQNGAVLADANEPTKPQGTTGYIKTRFSNESEDCIYRVYKNGEFYKVDKLKINGEVQNWLTWNNTSPKTKSIISQFKEKFANNSLETDLNKLLLK